MTVPGDAAPPRSPLAQEEIVAVWVAAAAALGWRVERTAAAYASTNGDGALLIGVDEILDLDDAPAQLIFHELCHGMVEGPARWSTPDWGLRNDDDGDVIHEHACLRVQVHLADPHGLRELMAPTTEYRAYHDAIVGDPLHPDSDLAATLAREAVCRPASRRWREVLTRALAETRAFLDSCATAPSQRRPGAAVHPTGFAFANGSETCGTCAWRYRGGRGRPVERCRQSAGADGNGRRTEAHFAACARWEAAVDCQTCGACCREAYHSVTVSMRDPVVWRQPQLVVRTGHRFEILRAGERCAALVEAGAAGGEATVAQSGGDQMPAAPVVARSFCCAIYEDRPRTCRDFEAGGRHCLVARRRVGLSA